MHIIQRYTYVCGHTLCVYVRAGNISACGTQNISDHVISSATTPPSSPCLLRLRASVSLCLCVRVPISLVSLSLSLSPSLSIPLWRRNGTTGVGALALRLVCLWLDAYDSKVRARIGLWKPSLWPCSRTGVLGQHAEPG